MTTHSNSMPFGIYVHVPWCRRRCPYCDFYFEVKKNLIGIGYARKVLQEWQHREKPAQKAQSLYFGGGTPSLLEPQEIDAIITGLEDSLDANAEITLELNPEDMSLEYLTQLAGTRVNRLSIGVQSFCPNSLRYLGRKHSASEGQAAIFRALACGFKNISIDLIIGVSGEDTQLIETALASVIGQGISHISMYMLTVEPGTYLEKMIGRGTRSAVNDDSQAAAYESMRDFIQSLGFSQYEISSFSRGESYSRHNSIYWSNGSYVGLGPGAHSMRLLDDGSVERRANAPDLKAWWQDPAQQSPCLEKIAPTDALKEALAFGVRNMRSGIDSDALAQRHQSSLPSGFDVKSAELLSAGYLQKDGALLRLTCKGALFADAVSRAFLGL